jgi:hypothetical protein
MDRRAFMTALAAGLAPLAAPAIAARRADAPPRPGERDTFSTGELLESGHNFFGNVSRGLALTLEEAVRRWGEPSGYILGQEGSGAFFGGLSYGEGVLYARRGRGTRIYWQGPSLGLDVGGEGSRSMTLVYGLRAPADLYRRFLEVDGSAYVVAGFGLAAAQADETTIVPIRSGVGLRLGVKLGYVKFTDAPTWNPF